MGRLHTKVQEGELMTKQARIRLEQLRAKQDGPFLMTVRHFCPSCKHIRQTPISAKVHVKQTKCFSCGSEYQLDRGMHITIEQIRVAK